MAFAYTIKDQRAIHFVTFTVHQWVDVFSRQLYVDKLLESVVFCQKEKGLEVYAWVVMSNHCHFILRAKANNLSDVIRDFKKFTAKSIYKTILENKRESRREWLLLLLSHNNKIWFWEEGYHGEEVCVASNSIWAQYCLQCSFQEYFGNAASACVMIYHPEDPVYL